MSVHEIFYEIHSTVTFMGKPEKKPPTRGVTWDTKKDHKRVLHEKVNKRVDISNWWADIFSWVSSGYPRFFKTPSTVANTGDYQFVTMLIILSEMCHPKKRHPTDFTKTSTSKLTKKGYLKTTPPAGNVTFPSTIHSGGVKKRKERVADEKPCTTG